MLDNKKLHYPERIIEIYVHYKVPNFLNKTTNYMSASIMDIRTSFIQKRQWRGQQ